MIGLIGFILMVIADIWFFKIMATGQSIDGIIILIVFIMPIFTLILAAIVAGITAILEPIIDSIYLSTNPKFTDTKSISDSEPDKSDYYVHMAIRNRCDALLKVADSIEHSDLNLKYDLNFIDCVCTIQSTKKYDYEKANAYCDRFEQFLLDNRDSVSMTSTGYRWLMVKGERY